MSQLQPADKQRGLWWVQRCRQALHPNPTVNHAAAMDALGRITRTETNK